MVNMSTKEEQGWWEKKPRWYWLRTLLLNKEEKEAMNGFYRSKNIEEFNDRNADYYHKKWSKGIRRIESCSLIENSKNLPPEFSAAVDKHFWELI
jgi:hypothetical protein